MPELNSKNLIEQKVFTYIEHHRLAAPGEKIVVAVSGGADSVCLLHVLWTFRDELGISLHAAHLDHRLRGAESEADAEYVRKPAGKLEVPVTVASRDVKTYRTKHRLSLEEAAREVRYTFLAETAGTVGAHRIAVGHTADDHIETVLMHLLRGSGTRGLRGLRPLVHRGDSDIAIIRPLLELARQETVDYCRRHGLEHRTDTSNLSTEPFRNRIRSKLLPELKKYNPKISEALARTARIAADDLQFIENEAARLADDILHEEGDSIVIDKEGLRALPTALKRQLLRSAIAKLAGDLKDIEARHIEGILDALDKPAGKRIGLPGGLGFVIEYNHYVLTSDPAALCPFPAIDGETRLNVPGRTRLPGWTIEAEITAAASEENSELTAVFDHEKAGNELFVRSARPGDRFRPLGMSGEKKLNRFMIDARIPRAWRERVPVVVSPEGIIWVAGYRIDDRARVTDATCRMLRLSFTRD